MHRNFIEGAGLGVPSCEGIRLYLGGTAISSKHRPASHPPKLVSAVQKLQMIIQLNFGNHPGVRSEGLPTVLRSEKNRTAMMSVYTHTTHHTRLKTKINTHFCLTLEIK